MNDVDKFTAYIRFSLYAGLVSLALLPFYNALIRNSDQGESSFGTWVALILTAINAIAAGLVLSYTPAISSSTPRRFSFRQVLIWYLALEVATFTLVLGLLHIPALARGLSQATMESFSLLALFLFLTLSYSLAPQLRLPQAIGLTLAGAALTSTFAQPPHLLHVLYLCGVGLFLLAASKLSFWSSQVVKELDKARELAAQLQVKEERLRFAQQLHDSIGQDLAAMSLKTQLALSLYRRGDKQVEDHLRDLEKIVRTTREDLNQVVDGFRTRSPEGELRAAKLLLDSADITVSSSGNPTQIPRQCAETAAWFIREATTNILKHSTATAATFEVSPDGITVTNDGAPETIGALGGTQTLQERAGRINGQIRLSNRDSVFKTQLTWKDPQ